MATVVSASERGPARSSSSWARRYPPLLALAAALLIAVAVLPSTLNLPQTNPATTLEFAPVPPDDETPPLQSGNLSSLGLGSTSGVAAAGPGGSGAGGGELPDSSSLGGVGKTPTSKNCVGSPPRQTADPLAPPCVADFRGDNFGATYQGVTGEEVRILIYAQGNYQYLNTAKGTEVTPNNEYDDIREDETDDDFSLTRQLRVWQRYFNDRFQTYGRNVHFYVYYSGSDDTPEARKAEAADNYNTIKPFAVISYAERNGDAYLEYMAQQGCPELRFVLVPAVLLPEVPQAHLGVPALTGADGQAVHELHLPQGGAAPHRFSGNQGENGQPRKLGLLFPDDGRPDELRAIADYVRTEVERCGGVFVSQRGFPAATYDYDLGHLPDYAVENMAEFQQKGVTTIIMPGGVETNQSKAAGQIRYYPEWVILGDTQNDQNTRGHNQDQTVYDHAVIVSNITKYLPPTEQVCYLAFKETAPDSANADAQQGCDFYNDLRQLFTGIQVAGPRLGPTSVDKGFHAIPHVPSSDPTVPGCFYELDDYTCVKDGIAERWDSRSKAPSEENVGCWRMIEGGKRDIAAEADRGGWPLGDVRAQFSDADPCNEYSVTVFTENPPDPDNPPE